MIDQLDKTENRKIIEVNGYCHGIKELQEKTKPSGAPFHGKPTC